MSKWDEYEVLSIVSTMTMGIISEHGYTYQNPVTGGMTHLSQTLKGRGSGF
jgi:hypothetical protein